MTVKARPSFSFGKLLMLMVTIFTMASCSNSGPQNINTVPADAAMVATIDFYSIASKGKLAELKEFKTYPKISELLNEESEVLGDLLSQMIDDPAVSGIDWSKKALFYLDNFENPSMYWAFEMKDKSKFRAMLDKIKEEAAADAGEIKSAEGFDYIDDRNMPLAWNDDVILMVFSAEYGSEATLARMSERFSNPADSSISTNAKFNSFYDEDNDMAMWMPMKQIGDMYSQAMMGMPTGMDFPDMEWVFEGESHMVMAMNYNQNDYTVSFRLDPSYELKAKLDEMYSGAPLDKDLLSYLPADSYMFASWHSDKSAKSAMMNMYGEETFAQVDAELAKANVPFSYTEILESIGEDVAFSVSNIGMEAYMTERYNYYTGETEMGEDMRPVVGFSAVMDLTNREVMDYAMDTLMTMSEGMLVNDGEQYYFNVPESGYTFRISYNDERAFFTTMESAMSSYLAGGFGDASLANTDLGEKAASKSFYVYFNMDVSAYPAEIQQMMASPMMAQAKPLMDMLKSLEVYPTGDYEGSYILNFHETDENALYELLSMFDNMGSQML